MSKSVVPYNMYEAQNAYQRLSFSLDRDSTDTAIAEINTFLKMFPDVALAHNDLGVLLHKAENPLLALAHYEKANRLQPGNPIIIRNLAEFYFAVLGWADDAIEMLTGLLTAYPTDFELLTSLGNISSQLGRVEESKVFYNKAYELDPDNTSLRKILADLNGPVSAAEYRSVPAGLSPVPPSIPASPVVRPEVVEIAQLQSLLVREPGNATACNNLAVLLYQEGRLDEAVKQYEQAVALEPSNAVYRKNLADVYYSALGHTDESIEIYTMLLKENPKDVEVLTALAIISKSNHLTEQARTFIKKVIDLEPWNSAARDFLADL